MARKKDGLGQAHVHSGAHVHGPGCAHDEEELEDDDFMPPEQDEGSDASVDPVQRFWGSTVSSVKELTVSLERAELHLTQACMVATTGSAVVFLTTNAVPDGVAICSLGAGSPRSALLDVELFPDDEYVTFKVVGDASVSLSGCIAILGGELIEADDEDEDDEGLGEEGDEEGDGALADEFGEDDDEEEDEEEEEAAAVVKKEPAQKTAPAAAPVPAVSAVYKMKQAKRQREEAAAPAVAAAAAPPQQQQPAKKQKPAPAPAPAEEAPRSVLTKLTPDGHVSCRDEIVGMGASPVRGKKVTVSYVGKLSNGTQFDAAARFDFKIGVGNVIKGWDVGVMGMKVGGKRTLVIHPSHAYGKAGSPSVIPPNSTLIFTVELLKV